MGCLLAVENGILTVTSTGTSSPPWISRDLLCLTSTTFIITEAPWLTMNQVKREISLGKWPTTLSWLPCTTTMFHCSDGIPVKGIVALLLCKQDFLMSQCPYSSVNMISSELTEKSDVQLWHHYCIIPRGALVTGINLSAGGTNTTRGSKIVLCQLRVSVVRHVVMLSDV